MSDAGEARVPAGNGKPTRRSGAIGAIAIALYAPQLWYFTMDYPWNDYRIFWLRFFPGLPAFVPGVFIRYPNEYVFAIAIWSLTGAAATLAYFVSQRSSRSFYIAVGILFAWSIASAVVAHFMFRA